MYLVAGATGLLGSEICRQLRANGKRVAGLVRPSSRPDRVQALREIGVQPVTGDLKDPQSLLRGCTGMKAIVSTASALGRRGGGDSIETVDRDGQRLLIDSARALRVPRFVYVSASTTVALRENPLVTAKRLIEKHLSASHLAVTVLRPSCFMEVWLSPFLGFDGIRGRAQSYGSGTTKMRWVSIRDVAAAAVLSLEEPATIGQTIAVEGPEALSQREVISIFEEITGMSFEVDEIAIDLLREQYAAAVDPVQKSMTALLLALAEDNPLPAAAGNTLPLRLTSVRDYAERVCGAAMAEA